MNLHYNGANSYLFVNGTDISKSKAKDSNIVASPLCLGNIYKDWSTDNMRKSAGYDAIGVNDIKDIHKYLTKKKNDMINMYTCLKTIVTK